MASASRRVGWPLPDSSPLKNWRDALPNGACQDALRRKPALRQLAPATVGRQCRVRVVPKDVATTKRGPPENGIFNGLLGDRFRGTACQGKCKTNPILGNAECGLRLRSGQGLRSAE